MITEPQIPSPNQGFFIAQNKALTMKWLLIALVVIADKIYDKYFDDGADDEMER